MVVGVAVRFQALCVAWSWFRQNGVVRPTHQYPVGA